MSYDANSVQVFVTFGPRHETSHLADGARSAFSRTFQDFSCLARCAVGRLVFSSFQITALQQHWRIACDASVWAAPEVHFWATFVLLAVVSTNGISFLSNRNQAEIQ